MNAAAKPNSDKVEMRTVKACTQQISRLYDNLYLPLENSFEKIVRGVHILAEELKNPKFVVLWFLSS